MRPTGIYLRQGRYILIAGMLLVIMVIAPAAHATSLAPATNADSDQASQADAPANPALSREVVKFLEDNWYFNYGAEDNQAETEARNPATADPTEGEFSFDAMERYPGLYNEPTDETSAPVVEEDYSEAREIDPALTADRITFLEDNWHLGSGALTEDDELTDDDSESQAIPWHEIQFKEDNWQFDTGESFPQDDVNDSASGPSSVNNADRADSLNELRDGSTNSADARSDRPHDELTYPWGGFQEHDH